MIEVVGPLVFGADREVAEWVRRRIRWVDSVEKMMPCKALGVARHGRFIAGVVYGNHVWPDIHVTCAADDKTWCTRQVLRAIVNYPFRQLGCSRITCITEDRNLPTQAFLEHFGFTEEGRHPFFFPDGGTAVSFGLYRETCRWLEEPNGQIRSSSA